MNLPREALRALWMDPSIERNRVERGGLVAFACVYLAGPRPPRGLGQWAVRHDGHWGATVNPDGCSMRGLLPGAVCGRW